MLHLAGSLHFKVRDFSPVGGTQAYFQPIWVRQCLNWIHYQLKNSWGTTGLVWYREHSIAVPCLPCGGVRNRTLLTISFLILNECPPSRNLHSQFRSKSILILYHNFNQVFLIRKLKKKSFIIYLAIIV